MVGIILSILFCVIRCACCGLDCCCGIFSFCRRSRRPKRSKYSDPFTPAPYQGYQPTPNPVYNAGGRAGAGAQSQFASFDVSKNEGKKVNEDSLPAMPSWDQGQEHRVYEEVHDHKEGGMEMGMEMGRVDVQQVRKETLLGSQHDQVLTSLSHVEADMGRNGAKYEQYDQGPYHQQQMDHRMSLSYQRQPDPLDHNSSSDLGASSLPPAYGHTYDAPYNNQMPSHTPSDHYHSTDGFSPPAQLQPQDLYDQHPTNSSPPPIQSIYSGYTPSISTQYEPSSVNAPAAYPGMPSYGRSRPEAPPGALQPGRRPGHGGWAGF